MSKNIQELIAERAYFHFLNRGGTHGYHLQDWLKAEKEIRKEMEKAEKITEDIKQKAAKETIKKSAAKKTTKKAAPKKTTKKVAEETVKKISKK